MQGNREAPYSISLKGVGISSHQFGDILRRHDVRESVAKLPGAYCAQLSCRISGIAAKLLQFTIVEGDFHWLSMQFPFTYSVNEFYYTIDKKPILIRS